MCLLPTVSLPNLHRSIAPDESHITSVGWAIHCSNPILRSKLRSYNYDLHRTVSVTYLHVLCPRYLEAIMGPLAIMPCSDPAIVQIDIQWRIHTCQRPVPLLQSDEISLPLSLLARSHASRCIAYFHASSDGRGIIVVILLIAE